MFSNQLHVLNWWYLSWTLLISLYTVNDEFINKLIDVQAVKKFASFYRSLMLVAMFATAHRWCLLPHSHVTCRPALPHCLSVLLRGRFFFPHVSVVRHIVHRTERRKRYMLTAHCAAVSGGQYITPSGALSTSRRSFVLKATDIGLW